MCDNEEKMAPTQLSSMVSLKASTVARMMRMMMMLMILPPLNHGIPQGLNSGEVAQVAEVELGGQPLRFKAGYCSLL